MTQQELIAHINRLLAKARQGDAGVGMHAEVAEFFRVYLGPKNAFYTAVVELPALNMVPGVLKNRLVSHLEGAVRYLEAGLQQGLSPERKAELDVVSDFLEMAQRLLGAPGVHPAAPAVLIGATLEEFLRSWVDAAALSLGNKKPGLEAYSQTLREADLITKQDGKDITSWSGIRNHAAHGEWDEVSDKARVSLMLEGINLFMRKYTPS